MEAQGQDWGGADVGGEDMIVRSMEPAVGPKLTTVRLQRQKFVF